MFYPSNSAKIFLILEKKFLMKAGKNPHFLRYGEDMSSSPQLAPRVSKEENGGGSTLVFRVSIIWQKILPNCFATVLADFHH